MFDLLSHGRGQTHKVCLSQVVADLGGTRKQTGKQQAENDKQRLGQAET